MAQNGRHLFQTHAGTYQGNKNLKLPSLRVSSRLSLSIIVPLIGLLGFAGLQIRDSLVEFRDYSDMRSLLNRVAEINDITSHLQNERSRAFLFSEESIDEGALQAAYTKTDQILTHVGAIASDIRALNRPKADEALALFEETLASLVETRAKTQSRELSSSGVVSAYTSIIGAALDIQRIAGRSTQSANIALEAVALNQISMAKEYASNEQAVIDGAIAKGKITKFAFEDYQRLVVSQDILIDSFLRQQGEKMRPVYEEILASRDVVDIKKLRGRTDRTGPNGKIKAKKYADWHEIAGKRIEQLRIIETTELNYIQEDAARLLSRSQNALTLWFSLSAVITLLTIVQAFILARSITKPLGGLTESLLALASGNLNTEIAGLKRRDELGIVAGAVEKLKAAAIEKEQLEALAEENRHLSENDRKLRDDQRAQEAAKLQKTVEALGEGLGRLSKGDLSRDIVEPFTPELDRLRSDFNLAQQHLRSVLLTVEASAQSIRGNAHEMRGSADELARRTEQQAASLEQTAASLEEITTNVRSSAEGAHEASTIAENAVGATKRSTAVVGEAIAAMDKLQQSSAKIRDIISVMDEIAFQTNLLALNAGVEAARAGEAGKGFAVVAQEVRELASRSGAAAKEISQLITTSNEDVGVGVKLVENTGETLNEIEGFMQEINARLTTIASSAREQSNGLGGINTAISQMDQMTQQNAAMVEETTAATHALGQEVEVLREGLSGFRLADGNSAVSSERNVA